MGIVRRGTHKQINVARVSRCPMKCEGITTYNDIVNPARVEQLEPPRV
jgi:hypothetical protein